MALTIFRSPPEAARPESMYLRMRLFALVSFSLVDSLASQSASRTSIIYESQALHRSHRFLCRTLQLQHHPTRCQKLSARAHNDPVFASSLLILPNPPSTGLASSPVALLLPPRRLIIPWPVNANASCRLPCKGPTCFSTNCKYWRARFEAWILSKVLARVVNVG